VPWNFEVEEATSSGSTARKIVKWTGCINLSEKRFMSVGYTPRQNVRTRCTINKSKRGIEVWQTLASTDHDLI
jgi:hypothetical protein